MGRAEQFVSKMFVRCLQDANGNEMAVCEIVPHFGSGWWGQGVVETSKIEVVVLL